MSLPHGALGQSAVCDCNISWPYSLVDMICLLAIELATSLYKHIMQNVVHFTLKIWSLTIHSLKRVAFAKVM